MESQNLTIDQSMALLSGLPCASRDPLIRAIALHAMGAPAELVDASVHEFTAEIEMGAAILRELVSEEDEFVEDAIAGSGGGGCPAESSLAREKCGEDEDDPDPALQAAEQ